MLQSLDSALSTLPTPTPNILVMGDMNFPRSCIHWEISDEGHQYPIVASHREEETPEGKQDRLQAQRLVDFAAKHFLQQVVQGPTHAAECLDLIWTNNFDLVSSCDQEDCRQFSDHKLVTARTTYKLNQEQENTDEQFLCTTGKRYKALDYSKASWPVISEELAKLDWKPMEELSKTSPEAALACFHENVLGVLESHVPKKKPRKPGGPPKMHRMTMLKA
jgi:hypothetical protein